MAVSLLHSGIINTTGVNVNDANADLSYSSLGCTETIVKAVPDKGVTTAGVVPRYVVHSMYHGTIERSGRLFLANSLRIVVNPFKYGVIDGIRTHENRSHNPAP